MPTPSSTTPSPANLNGTVPDNLQAGSALQPQISAALNTELKSQLTAAATKANRPALVGLINTMPTVDLAAAKDLTLPAPVAQQVGHSVGNGPRERRTIHGRAMLEQRGVRPRTTIHSEFRFAERTKGRECRALQALRDIGGASLLRAAFGVSRCIGTAFESAREAEVLEFRFDLAL